MPGWVEISGRTFYLGEVHGGKKTFSWYEADAKATAVGGYLAEITSEDETKIIQEIKRLQCMFI